MENSHTPEDGGEVVADNEKNIISDSLGVIR